MKFAVVGAGWAGLSAAFELHDAGHQVTVFEAGHRLGGRARGLHSPKLDAALDNGQHIMLGAYTDTLALMRRLGLEPDEQLYSMPLDLQSANGDFRLRVSKLPDALALPAALLSARGLGWSERWRLAILMSGLSRRGWQVDTSPTTADGQGRSQRTVNGLTVAEWLVRDRQSARLIRNLWEPLCLASMNTPINLACAQLFANVLRDSLGAGPEACRVLIPRVDLSTLWPEKLPAGIRIMRGHAVRRLEMGQPLDAVDNARNGRQAALATHNGVLVDGHQFDAAVIATNVQPARRLLSQLPFVEGSRGYLSMLDAFRPMPIATLTLELSGLWSMPHPMLMLADSPQNGRFGQWLFHCNAFLAQPLATSRLNIVISNAGGLRDFDEDQIVQGVLAQIAEQAAGMSPMPSLRGYELITEKRATFAAVPGLKRPSNTTPWPHIYAAADWTDTGYPAVLEGAVRSGLQAARALKRQSPRAEKDVQAISSR